MQIVIRSLFKFISDDSFVSVDLVDFAFVENMSPNLRLLL
jgi:hypothetical protein